MEFEDPRRGKKRKGGVKQRMARAAEEMSRESALEVLLMTYLAQGLISGAVAHSIAQAAATDLQHAREGYSFPALERLASLAQGRNLIRQVYNQLEKSSSLPNVFTCDIPYKGGIHPGSILLPHELFAHFFDNPDFWQQSVLPDQAKLEEFWRKFDGHPVMTNHPIKQKRNYRTHGVPLGLHGDEVPVLGVGKIWSRSCLCFSWCSLIANACGAAMDNVMFLVWTVFEKFCIPSTEEFLGTMDTFFAVLRWSFQALFEGTWPRVDWAGRQFDPTSQAARNAGQPLANGFFAVLLQLSGDLDYYSKYLNLPKSTSHQPCAQCRAEFYGANSWCDNRQNSPWQQQLLTTENWRLWWNTSNALFELPGFSCWSVAYDLMHCSFLGALQHLYGSIIWLLVYECLPAEPLDNLKVVWDFIVNFQKGDPSRHPYRHRLEKLTMFEKAKGYPKLRGKAADIQGLDLALCKCFQQYMDPDNHQHVQASALLELNVEIGQILDSYSPKFGFMAVPEEQHETLVLKSLQMTQLHVQLCEHYQETDISLFNITAKTHFCIHVYLLSKYIHPSVTWCFKGENMMRTSSNILKSCLHGNKHWNVGRVALLKFRHLLQLALRKAWEKKCTCSFLCDSAVYLCGHVFTHELTILEWMHTCACANILCFIILVFSLRVKMFSDFQINEKLWENRVHSLVFSLVSKQKSKIFW